MTNTPIPELVEVTPSLAREWYELERAANNANVGDEIEIGCNIGERDGYSRAVQTIDLLTGGDGEYRFCTDHNPERHTPDPVVMIGRIVDRFDALTTSQARIGVLEEALEGIANRPSGAPDTALRVVSELSLIARLALSHKVSKP